MIRPPRQLLMSALLVALAAPGVYAQDSIDQLADLIRTSTTSADPSLAFVTGFNGLGDFNVGTAQIRDAVQRSGVSTAGPLDGLLNSTTSISKRGSRVAINRTQTDEFLIDGGSGAQFGKTIGFDLSKGFVGALGSDDAARMLDARGDYIHLDSIKGIKVKEAGGGFYTLYEAYHVTEVDGTPVVHLRAGTWFYTKWVRVPLAAPAPTPTVTASAVTPTTAPTIAPTTAPTSVPAATVADPLAGLPVLTDVVDLTAATPIIRETVPTIRDENEPEEAGIFVADDSTDEILIGSPETTEIVPEETAQQIATESRQGLLDRLEETVVDSDETDELAQALASDDSADESREQAQAEEQAEADDDTAFDVSAAAKGSDEEDAAAQETAPTEIPFDLPEQEEQDRIDEGVEVAKAELDTEGDRLAQLIALIKSDRSEAERRMTVRIEDLDKRNKALELKIAELSEKLEGRDAPSSRYTADFTQEDSLAELDARYRANRAQNAGSSPMSRFGRSVSGPRTDDRSPLNSRDANDRRSFDNRGVERYEARISGPNSQNDRNVRDDRDDNSKMSGLKRLFLRLLDGVAKSLKNKYANETARNMNMNARVLAGNNANNRGYVDNRMRNAMVNSNLGRTAGINSYAGSPNVLYAAPETTRIVPSTGVTLGTTFSSPSYTNARPLNTPRISGPVGGTTILRRR
jgi:hypothetical protein